MLVTTSTTGAAARVVQAPDAPCVLVLRADVFTPAQQLALALALAPVAATAPRAGAPAQAARR